MRHVQCILDDDLRDCVDISDSRVSQDHVDRDINHVAVFA